MPRPNSAQIRNAAQSAGISLDDQELARLEKGETLPITQGKVRAAAAAGGCSGIKLVDLGGGCGLYLIPFPPQISVCCET